MVTKKILNDNMLLTALRAEAATIEKFKSEGRNDYCSFLGTYIVSGRETLITRDFNMRDVMLSMDRKALKKELLILLFAQTNIEKGWTRVIRKKDYSNLDDNNYFNYQYIFIDLFTKLRLDSKDYEKVFDYLVENHPREFDKFISNEIKNFFQLDNYTNKEIAEGIIPNENEKSQECNPLYKAYYDKDDLKVIDNFRKGKKRLKVISIKRIEEYTKRLSY